MTEQAPSTESQAAPEKRKLAGRAQWLTVPSGFANCGVGVVLVYYCSQTMDLPEGSMARFLVTVGTLTCVLMPAAFAVYAKVLRVTALLGKGKAPLDGENLSQAAREVHRFADIQFWLLTAMWVGGTSLGMPALHWFVGIPWDVCWRIFLNALTLAPIGALLTYLLALVRTRQLLRELSEAGLGFEGLARAIPPTRLTTRLRLMVFAAVLVISPAAITADLVLGMLRNGMVAIQSGTTATERAANAATTVQDAMTAVGVLGGMILAFALSIAYIAGNALGAPMQALAREAKRLTSADRGALQVVPAEDELWALSVAFLGLQAQTSEVLAQLKTAGSRISVTTESLVSVAKLSEDGSSTQAMAMGATSATTEELAQAARLITQSATEVATAAQKTLTAAKAGQASSRAFLESTERLRGDNAAISAAVTALRGRVERISKIVEFINGVADRADLLALNAELEGTKAGEIGRGFSLVAGEMRRMAEQVVRTTREIEALIADVHRAAAAAAQASEEGQAGTRSGATLALELSETLDRIHGIALATSEAASSISTATGQQHSGAAELAQAMASVLKVTEGTVKTTREMASATRGLDDLSRTLGQAMEQLQVRS